MPGEVPRQVPTLGVQPLHPGVPPPPWRSAPSSALPGGALRWADWFWSAVTVLAPKAVGKMKAGKRRQITPLPCPAAEPGVALLGASRVVSDLRGLSASGWARPMPGQTPVLWGWQRLRDGG